MSSKTLLSNIFTTAQTLTTTPVVYDYKQKASVLLQAVLAYGSGGTTIDAWVQTSIDGVNWIDVCNFHFTTASAKFLFNLSALTPVTSEYTLTDGTLTANTAKDGIIGNLWRVKYQSSGTYAGNTTLTIQMSERP